jgi:CrcB protein
MLRLLGPSFPFGTLTVNLVGSFLIGAIMHIGLTSTVISPAIRLFLTTGIMGGLTTYSTFNYETIEFLRNGTSATAVANIGVTVFGCLGAGALGIFAGRWMLAGFTVPS